MTSARRTFSSLRLRASALLATALLLGGCEGDVGTDPPVGHLDKASLDFGSVVIGQTADRSFVLSNDGGSDLTGTLSAPCPEFTIVAGAGGFSLGEGEALEVTVSFRPVSTGSKVCIVSTGNSSLRTVGCVGTAVDIPTGACCSPDGTCAMTTEAACSAPSAWSGEETTCSPNPCVQPLGACCATDGSCSLTVAADCAGAWMMFGSCAPNPCPQPSGACCAADGSCSVTVAADCAGAWMMFGSCAPNPCPQPSGACCAADGSCSVTVAANCAGAWTMFGACEPNPCAQPSGSCCAADGSCSVTTDAGCPGAWTMFDACEPNPCDQPTGSCCAADGSCSLTTDAGCPGSWTMFGDCSPNPCPPPTGSCCALDGGCAVGTQANCTGSWTLLGTCDPNPCVQPTGACCAPDGACSLTTRAACADAWTMFGVCDPNPCPQPTGACCTIDGACSMTAQAECRFPSSWVGARTTCAPSPCQQPTGSCCTQTGICSVTLHADCATTWTMFGVCDPNPCAQPVGSCCVPSGVCTVTTFSGCSGVWTLSSDCSPNPCPQPTGACCARSGVCSVTTAAACGLPSIWQGAGTDCSPNPCAIPTGACCATDGSCTVTTDAACSGSWTMSDDCIPNPCPQPTGACCSTSGACTLTTQAACAAPSVWQGVSTICSPNPCQQPTGACCDLAGGCNVVTQASCLSPNIYQGAGTSCSPNPCLPVGACCAITGTCTPTTQAACAAPSVWQGAATVCSPNPCPQPTGACCTPVGVCSVVAQAACVSPNMYQGAWTTCSPNPCIPVGACCAITGTCTTTTQAACVAPSVWQGAATVCSPNPCPQPTGACCTPSGTCAVVTQASCASPNTWQGAGTTCTPNPCPSPTITVGPASIPGGTVGVLYNQTFTASGGTAPYTYEVSAGAIPPDMSLSAGGLLSGTPSGAGTYNFTILATDAASHTGLRAYALGITTGGLDLSLPVAYITQSTQTQAFDVPLVQDRNGLLRAFVIASGSNSLTPAVRVRIYDGGSLLQTYTIPAPGAAVPTTIDESSLSRSWNVAIPGSLIQPGYSLKVDVDPSGLVPESDESNNEWPAPGTAHPLDVRDLQILNMTLVPVHTTSGTGGVNAGNAASYMDITRRLHPIPDYDAQVRTTMNSSATLGSDGTGWETMLNEVTAQRTVDGSSDYYFGVAHVLYSSGVAGIGWVGYPVATGWDYLPSASGVLAHEIGHNWNYGHTRCTGTESGPDPNYPYAGGVIGAYGYDLWSSALKDKTTYKDVMSYCNPQWISDYTYKKILAFRASSPIGLFKQNDGLPPKEPCLLVWGLRRYGEISLEPSFSISTRPVVPTPGPYAAEGLDASGRVIWSQDFDLMRTTHPTDETSAGFCFAVPMPSGLLDRIVAIRIVEGGREVVRRTAAAPPGSDLDKLPAGASITRLGSDAVDLAWDSARAPVVMLRDPDRDACIGFAREGRTRIDAPSGRLELLFSDGVHTRVVTWPQE